MLMPYQGVNAAPTDRMHIRAWCRPSYTCSFVHYLQPAFVLDSCGCVAENPVGGSNVGSPTNI